MRTVGDICGAIGSESIGGLPAVFSRLLAGVLSETLDLNLFGDLGGSFADFLGVCCCSSGEFLMWTRFLRSLPVGVSIRYDLGSLSLSVTTPSFQVLDGWSWNLMCWPGFRSGRSFAFLSW